MHNAFWISSSEKLSRLRGVAYIEADQVEEGISTWMTKAAMRSSLPTMVLVSFSVKARCFLQSELTSCHPQT